MADILVVDDSAVERTVVAAILNKRFQEAHVVTAAGGAEALELIDSRRFDLVITDLMMPELDGFELVQRIRQRELDVPIILMTGFGNEQTAVNALRAGAANYVPKQELDFLLVPTVENVLAMSQFRHSKTRLLSCISDAQIKFTIGNDENLIAPLIAYVHDQIRIMQLLGKRDVVRLAVALHESLTNAILHGNLEVSSDLRHDDDSLFQLVANERRKQPPYCHRELYVDITLSAAEIRISVRDQGPGFDVRNAMNQPVDLGRMGGRGLLLMRSFMDVVYHNAAGNEITMIKFTRVKQAGAGAETAGSPSKLATTLESLQLLHDEPDVIRGELPHEGIQERGLSATAC